MKPPISTFRPAIRANNVVPLGLLRLVLPIFNASILGRSGHILLQDVNCDENDEEHH